jgi:hypothetical protein
MDANDIIEELLKSPLKINDFIPYKLIVRPICDAVSGISTERNWMNDNILKT